jgi:hypothetical protein
MMVVRPDHPPYRFSGVLIPVAERQAHIERGWTVVDDLDGGLETPACGHGALVLMQPPDDDGALS